MRKHMLGLPEMDAQHDQLYKLFERIDDSTEVGDSRATAELLSEIDSYLLFHMESEEHFIRMYKAPGYTVHKGDHEQTAEKVVEFMEDFEKGKLNPGRLRRFLIGWLLEHSRTIDEEYAAEVRRIRGDS